MRIGWNDIAELCPRESAEIHELLHQYDIPLADFLRGVTGDKDWCKVVDVCDMGLAIGELNEAKLEDRLVSKLIQLWERLADGYERATETNGVCRKITEIFFENEYAHERADLAERTQIDT